ncbi:serine/threonine-protein kinase [Cryobacterium sp. TMT1-21]|uniref:serine/threonine-protein kinase n=1 Tax=Cryobacterium sp. TMT1-21 TaxID=1259234 RepID=UPI001F544023|nr:serine/threonine-protein kinase [Cryobacterium sp. TMT1-21]
MMGRAVSLPPELPGYDYVQTLGSGGFSDVFLYDQQLPRRRVAVKVLLTEQLNESTRARFVDEANLMARLSTHPSIVTIYHAGVAGDGRPYFVMEYCSGPSLSERYKRDPFTVEDSLHIGVRLAGAVATAHAAGILHRDIKPGNVLTNDFGGPALTDFGISSTLESDLPVQAQAVGPAAVLAAGAAAETQSVGMSVPWSPPEMFEDDPVPDVRSDVFSLAATIHTLLAGRTPFEIRGRSNGTLDLIGRIERGAITPIGRGDVPRSLEAVLAKGMAQNPAARYASAVDFARALQRIELELGYSATAIEVPRLAPSGTDPSGRPARASADSPAGADETRARSVVSIAAQPAGAAPVPSAPSPDGGETRVRGAVVIRPQSPRNPATPESGDATVMRGRASDTVLRPRKPVVPTGESLPHQTDPPNADASNADPAEPAARRRRGLVLLISAAAGVALIGAVVAAVVVTGSQTTPGMAPVKTPSSDSGDAAMESGVPVLTLTGTATSVDGTVVTFTVANPDPEEGDVYRWARAETPNQPKLSSTADIAVDEVTPGERVCVDLYLQRGDGKLSEANRVCNR